MSKVYDLMTVLKGTKGFSAFSPFEMTENFTRGIILKILEKFFFPVSHNFAFLNELRESFNAESVNRREGNTRETFLALIK